MPIYIYIYIYILTTVIEETILSANPIQKNLKYNIQNTFKRNIIKW